MPVNTETYTTRLQVRPDDIDMFGHVHSSRYMDFVLAARFEQMERCYRMSMQEFLDHNLGWYLSAAELRFLRPLKMGDFMDVQTRIVEMGTASVRVEFTILLSASGKTSCKGWAEYVLVDVKSGRSKSIPDWIIQRYSLPDDSIS
ncbi:MAG: acyl-CoA thioesterase [Sphingomonadales bacterium]|nr:acyl-CoA thioesterase [Sphingomonadales bacterium]